MTLTHLKKELKEKSCPKYAEILKRFFKTGPGDYSFGDKFLGIKVPTLRKIAKDYKLLSLNYTLKLLKSPLHEERLIALILMEQKFSKGDPVQKKKIVNQYIKSTKYINNWDLVDLSAPKILGCFLYDKNPSILYKLVRSKNLWRRRIAIISTFYFIKNNKFDNSLELSEILLHDKEDLIHKAVGWMLREIWKRDKKPAESFIKKHYSEMPRTMLRYAIEKFPETKRKKYLKGKFKP